MRPQSARGYRYLVVPKELIENLAFSSLDFGAVILYAKILKRAGLSAQHEDKFPDEHGRLRHCACTKATGVQENYHRYT